MVKPFTTCPTCGMGCVQLIGAGVTCEHCKDRKPVQEFGTTMFKTEFDVAAAATEGAIRDKLISLGWAPPGEARSSPSVRTAAPPPSREEVWLRIYAALGGALGCDGSNARAWADKALEEFDKRFPPK